MELGRRRARPDSRARGRLPRGLGPLRKKGLCPGRGPARQRLAGTGWIAGSEVFMHHRPLSMSRGDRSGAGSGARREVLD